jgi:hypothetical protein
MPRGAQFKIYSLPTANINETIRHGEEKWKEGSGTDAYICSPLMHLPKDAEDYR